MGSSSVIVGVASIATLLSVVVLFRQTLLLLVILACMHVGTLYLLRSKRYLAIYAAASVLGPAAEAISIYAGAWSYSDPSFLGIPLWLPLVWGSAGVLFMKLSETLHAARW